MRKYRIIAVVLITCILTMSLVSIPKEEYEASEKVESTLLDMMDVTYEELTSGDFCENGEIYSCIIWIEDVEIEEAVESGIDEAEKTRENYSRWSWYDYPYTTYESEGLTYVDVKLDEAESDEYVQTYIEEERQVASELYSQNNNSFVANNFKARDMSVNYVSKYSPCVFADLSATKIAELIKNDDVERITYAGAEDIGVIDIEADADDFLIPKTQILKSVDLVRVDEAVKKYDVTGAGIKIGQIEPTCPEYSSIKKNPSAKNTKAKGKFLYHANNVYNIMKSVAPDATYYATGLYSSNTSENLLSFYEQVEWLLSQGVNIINMSMGYTSESLVNKYTGMARWVDHIAYNHDVHFVKSAGNYMKRKEELRGVSSPGMAYNIITVGNIYRKASDGYLRHESSSYNHDGDPTTTYKPDLVAPGGMYYASEDVNETQTGTSFATPLVTGTIALLCEYKPALKVQQHIVKAILAATTWKEARKYVTVNKGFESYGAGMVDAYSALNAVYKGNYSTSTGTLTNQGTTKSYTMKVTEKDTTMRVALAYANRIEYASDEGPHPEDEKPSGEIGSLSLLVYSPNGTLVKYVYSKNLDREANLKVLEFNPKEYGVGDYVIKVIVSKEALNRKKINFGVAWR